MLTTVVIQLPNDSKSPLVTVSLTFEQHVYSFIFRTCPGISTWVVLHLTLSTGRGAVLRGLWVKTPLVSPTLNSFLKGLPSLKEGLSSQSRIRSLQWGPVLFPSPEWFQGALTLK